jgi:hypothetical protein
MNVFWQMHCQELGVTYCSVLVFKRPIKQDHVIFLERIDAVLDTDPDGAFEHIVDLVAVAVFVQSISLLEKECTSTARNDGTGAYRQYPARLSCKT